MAEGRSCVAEKGAGEAVAEFARAMIDDLGKKQPMADRSMRSLIDRLFSDRPAEKRAALVCAMASLITVSSPLGLLCEVRCKWKGIQLVR